MSDSVSKAEGMIRRYRIYSQRAQRRLEDYAGQILITPPLAILALVLGIPILFNIYASFFSWDGTGFPTDFVGFANYGALFSDPTVLRSIGNTILWTVCMVVVPPVIGLFFALLLDGLPGRTVFKAIVFLPYVISFVAVAMMWRVIYNSNGLLNLVLEAIGFDQFTKAWLGTEFVNTFSMMVTQAWLLAAFAFIVYFAGLQSIPENLLEAGRVGGLSPLERIRYVKVPLLRPFTTVVVATILINVLKIFDVIWVMTEGGPHYTSETLAVTMYRAAFVQYRFGYGAAVANILTLVVIVVAVAYIYTSMRDEVQYQ